MPRLTHATGAPVADNLNIQTAGRRGPALLQDIRLLEKLAHADREVIPERRMHAKGSGAFGTFTKVTIVMSDRGLPDGYRFMHGFGATPTRRQPAEEGPLAVRWFQA